MEEIVAYFEVLYQDYIVGTEENYEKSGSPVSGLRFEPCSPVL
jgi:hypothetical protein